MKELLDKVADFLNKDIDFLDVGKYSPAVYLIAGGVICVLLAFFVAVIVRSFSKTKKLIAQLDDSAAYINAIGYIGENNIELANGKVQELPDVIRSGWGCFLEQQTGYPSDYITEKDFTEDETINPSHKKARGFFKIASFVVIAVCCLLSALAHIDSLSTKPEDIILIALFALGAVCLPFVFFLIFLALLNYGYRKREKKLVAAFNAFRDALDSKVMLFKEGQDEFITENIEEINATIEEILANKLDDKEIIEIITAPIIDGELDYVPEILEIEEASEEVVEEPQEQKAEEVVASAETEEDRTYLALLNLVYATDAMIQDPRTTAEDMDEMIGILRSVRLDSRYRKTEEQNILEDCTNLLIYARESK